MCQLIFRVSVLVTLVSVFGQVQGTRVYEMNLVNLTYGTLSKDIEFNMTINQEGMMTVNAVLYKESSDYYYQIIAAFDDGKGDYSNIFLNKTIDVCKFLSTKSYETLVQLYYKQLLKHENNIPATCPLGGGESGVHYFVRNVELSGMPVPPYVPSSNAYVQVFFMIKENDGQFRKLSTGKFFMNFKKL